MQQFLLDWHGYHQTKAEDRNLVGYIPLFMVGSLSCGSLGCGLCAPPSLDFIPGLEIFAVHCEHATPSSGWVHVEDAHLIGTSDIQRTENRQKAGRPHKSSELGSRVGTEDALEDGAGGEDLASTSRRRGVC